MEKKIKVNLIFKPGIPSSREKGGGDQTACKMLYEALKRRKDIEVYYNGTLKEGPYDILHFHSLGDIFFRYVKQSNKSKIVFTAHVIADTMLGSAILAEKWKSIFAQYLLLFYNQADVVIAVSPLEVEKLKEMGVKTEIVFIPNGIDLSMFKKDEDLRREMRKKFNLSDEDIVLLSVGHIIKRKGFDTFVKAAESLPQYKFLWVGGVPFSFLSGGYAEIKKILKNPPSNLILPGPSPHEELNKFYNMADIFFFPSRQENFSIAVLEASAVGLPLLLRDLEEYKAPLAPNYIPWNENDVIKKIVQLAENKDLREEYSKRAVVIAETYNIEKTTEATVNLYKKLLGVS
ncbi:glycosyltransferase family 4 protein [Dictyoglomus sp.]|uniref:glycosyltransferase family 4 protein n=1 Tax=Dictyoglomus sp. TaxID=28205 RepID=UPI003D0D3A01